MRHVLILAILALLAVPVQAETATAKIVTVDVSKVLKDSTAAQDIRKQLDAQREKYQTEIKKEEERLRAAEQEIVKARTTLTKEQLAEKQGKLRTDFRGVETKVQQRRKALDSAYTQGMKKIHDALQDIVLAEAKTAGATIVLPKAETMWHAPELEVTDNVLKALNAKLPTVKITISESAAPAKKQ
jgi:Skp family chaperone for outer membrane proteins